jgi:hypothetical protein
MTRIQPLPPDGLSRDHRQRVLQCRLAAALRATVTGARAAATAGVASAVVTRALMHAVAVLVREPTSFSVTGSAGIALIYTIALLPGCIALASTRRRWPWAIVGAGGALLLFEAVNIGIQETNAAHDMTPVCTVTLGVVLLAMVAAYALQIHAATRWSRRRPLASARWSG